MSETCFACANIATTREHVPPRCLFPERKDALGGRDYRRNLVTVPACGEHNAAKSDDDWYFLWVVSTNMAANNVGTRQAFTKVGRSHRRRPALGHGILEDATDVLVIDSRSGVEHEAAEAPLDEVRFKRVLKLVALGIYRHHFQASWLDEVRAHADFIAESDAELKPQSNVARQVLFEAASKLFGSEPRYGENPDVFWYQVHEPEARYRCLMRLVFYAGCTATAFFKRSG
jgi:hypothetical protein